MESKVRIELLQTGRARIFINDVEIREVRSIEVRAEAGAGLNTLHLTLIPKEISITGMADVSEQFAILGQPAQD